MTFCDLTSGYTPVTRVTQERAEGSLVTSHVTFVTTTSDHRVSVTWERQTPGKLQRHFRVTEQSGVSWQGCYIVTRCFIISLEMLVIQNQNCLPFTVVLLCSCGQSSVKWCFAAEQLYKKRSSSTTAFTAHKYILHWKFPFLCDSAVQKIAVVMSRIKHDSVLKLLAKN